MAYTTPATIINHHHSYYSSIVTVTNYHHHHLLLNPSFNRHKFTPSFSSLSLISSLNLKIRCGASSPRPPDSGPPPGDEQDTNSGSIASFSRLQESVQIFFAVLFWMSLFFWSSVWDGRNNGRSNKGPRFRK